MIKYLKIMSVIAIASGLLALMAMNVLRRRSNSGGSFPDHRDADYHNKQAVDSAVSLLRSGNVVLRMGTGADSYLLSRMNRKNKRYSHCGIVMIENGYPFVYHSIGGEDNPDERLRRDSARLFFSPAHNTGIAVVRYDYDDSAIARLRRVVLSFYNDRPKFDTKFDLTTDDKLYCSEFVCKAINKAMNDNSYINATTVLGYKFIGTDDLFINRHAHIFWEKKFK